jgi:hypothetical protein
MVVKTREQTKLDFAHRLNEALDDVTECPRSDVDGGRGRAAWVGRHFKVSGEAARKWLAGETIPDQTNMARLAAALNVTPFWLHAGQLPKSPPPFDQTLTDIQGVIAHLNDVDRIDVLEFARDRRDRRQSPPLPVGNGGQPPQKV